MACRWGLERRPRPWRHPLSFAARADGCPGDRTADLPASGLSASRAFPTICGPCWPAARPPQEKPSTSSSIVLDASLDRLPRRWAVSMRWCSPQALASTRPNPSRSCRDARWLGVTLDEKANANGGPRISSPGSAVSAWVIPTDENLMIARHARGLLDREEAR